MTIFTWLKENIVDTIFGGEDGPFRIDTSSAISHQPQAKEIKMDESAHIIVTVSEPTRGVSNQKAEISEQSTQTALATTEPSDQLAKPKITVELPSTAELEKQTSSQLSQEYPFLQRELTIEDIVQLGAIKNFHENQSNNVDEQQKPTEAGIKIRDVESPTNAISMPNTVAHTVRKETDIKDNKPYEEHSPGPFECLTQKCYKVYLYRWFVLCLFVVLSASNSAQWFQMVVIADVVCYFYQEAHSTVIWTAMIYSVTYIPLIFPAMKIINAMGLRVAVTIACCGTCFGSWIKAFASSRHLFWLAFSGQTLVGMSQVFILNVPPRLASLWFPPDQVSRACAIGVFGNQLGVAVGFVLPPAFVQAGSSVEDLSRQFNFMFTVTAVFCTIIVVFIILFFKSAPPTPPSIASITSTLATKTNFTLILKNLFTNKNFILLVISYGINVGVFYAISTMLNAVVLLHYPTANKDVGRIGLVLVISGMVATVVYGFILDQTRRFKQVTVFLYVGTVIVWLIFTFTLNFGLIYVVYITGMLLGFFMAGYLPVGYEFASEITFPEPESTTSGILNAAVQVQGIILTLLYEIMLRHIGDLYTNLAMAGLLVLGVVITLFIKSDLRRQSVLEPIVGTT